MISGTKYASENRVDQVYLTGFGDVRIYLLLYRKEYHTSLSWYFINTGVPEHLHLDNAWEMTKSSK